MPIVRTIILGAAGRDFHNFNMLYRNDEATEVVAFTAQQIPHIADRIFPRELAGPRYPEGIPVYAEERLETLIAETGTRRCVLSYSDLAYADVMRLATRVNAAGAAFLLPSPAETMLHSVLPVVAVCASRTGAGKSQTTRAVATMLRDAGLRVVILRHPMPYGDLIAQRAQRFASMTDLARQHVTIEEREEYEEHIAAGFVVWAGVDYRRILHEAEAEADVIVWDGGNNDTSFLAADLYIAVVDPHRAGDEVSYYPGETNVRLANVILVNKTDTARPEDVHEVERNVRAVNPRARVLRAQSPIDVDDIAVISNKRVIAIEDGPTLTHGGMAYGAAVFAARRLNATLEDPRRFAVGEIADSFRLYPHIGPALPALGYGERQIRELQTTLEAAAQAGVEAVVVGTPIDLGALIRMPLPYTRVRYSLRMAEPDAWTELLAPVIRLAHEQRAADPIC